MKKFVLLFLFFGLVVQLNAQDEPACEPDLTYQDSSAGAYPVPFNPETGVGGLADFPACINEEYELVFTLKLGDSISIGAVSADLIGVRIATTGAVTGLPSGLNYFCNPPNCEMQDTVLGCIVIRGTPDAGNATGTYDLVISGEVLVAGLLPLPISFPGTLFPGEYSLTLNGEGQCATTSVNEYLAENISLSNTPNPVVGETRIEFNSLIGGDFTFQVFNLNGGQIYSEPVRLSPGYNMLNFNASHLTEGMYIYSLSNGNGAISRKMMVKRP